MNGFVLTYLLIFAAISWQNEDEQGKSRQALFNLVAENFRLEGSVIFSKAVNSLLLCSHFCLGHDECNRINYHLDTSMCEILNVNPCEFGEDDLIPAFGWMHLEDQSSQEVDAVSSICNPIWKNRYRFRLVNSLFKYTFCIP